MTNGNSADAKDILVAEFNDLLNDAIGANTSSERIAARKELVNAYRAALSVCADGGKGEAVGWALKEEGFDHLVFDHETGEKPSALDMEWAMERGHQYIPLYTTPQAECAPLLKQEPLGEPFQTVLDENRWYLYAECAPREAKPVAWRYFDGEGNYEYRDEPPSESSVYHASIYGRKFEPLYLASPTPERAQESAGVRRKMLTTCMYAVDKAQTITSARKALRALLEDFDAQAILTANVPASQGTTKKPQP